MIYLNMGNCTSADYRESPEHHQHHPRRRSDHRSHQSYVHRPNHRSRDDEPDGLQLDPCLSSAHVGPQYQANPRHREGIRDHEDERVAAELERQRAPSLFTSLGPDQPTAALHFPITSEYETLQNWGYVVNSISTADTDGQLQVYQKIMYTGDLETGPYYLARVRISPDNHLVINLIDTENAPGSSRPRPRASNILLAFWTGSGRHASSLRGLRFENVIEQSTREVVGPRAYAMLGRSLYARKLRVTRVDGEVFKYIAENSKLARMVWSILQCREMGDANVEITEFVFRTLPVDGVLVAAEDTPFRFDIKLGVA